MIKLSKGLIISAFSIIVISWLIFRLATHNPSNLNQTPKPQNILPTPIPVQNNLNLSNWTEFRSTKPAYSLKYPPDWILSQDFDISSAQQWGTVIESIRISDPVTSTPVIEITILADPVPVFMEIYNCTDTPLCTTQIINTVEFVSINADMVGLPHQSLFIARNQDDYFLLLTNTQNSNLQPIVDSILNTISFDQ